ncbi:FAD-binding oxidoreductase [Fusobacterium necrophorum]|uniref:FAD-dependent oxidoreductase n=1 Tax=Fusobacterium necrophorum TaxID=859 RepID=UPI0008920451|nr:FAD-dependent oxidoreductase [Fusobacterium necrophorum]AYZ73053.1 FAD-binding oxidoreductase [Fusobacterium necrophorum]AZW08949.1 FAD-binding oxidoreductase [Fusobacterium necrophorum subsp. necrophorum]SDB39955.1 FAD dependent oxidoreductase [Fusobacterium necrophorum]SQD09934.1 hydroxyglutarate oxidase [Fusobacterium necrophorum subsp. necrophorum]
MNLKYDKIIIGAGIYGMYAAKRILKKNPNMKVLILEIEKSYFRRASYINQARLHNGYHYPRSYSTALKTVRYFDRFYRDFHKSIHDGFEKIYAIASEYSWTNGEQFQKFCDNLGVKCEEIPKKKYFNEHTIDKAFLTEEVSFDAKKIGDQLYQELVELNCEIQFNTEIIAIKKERDKYILSTKTGKNYVTSFILNATYAGTNKIHSLIGFEYLPIKYEFCEVILCEVSENIRNVGLTVMDGPFFSIMPFGLTGYHSITSVSRTPHFTSYEFVPPYDCGGEKKLQRTEEHKKACIHCGIFPKTAFDEMVQIARKYLNSEIEIKYIKSLYTIKPIMLSSEIDDSRPTIIKQYSEKPDFYTVFSGKVNAIYDLDEIL